LPGSSTSTSVLYQHQRENRANSNRTAGLGFGESGSLGELPTHSSREGDRDSPAQVQLQHQNHRASTYSLNDPVPYQASSNSTRYSSSSSTHFPTSTSTSISPATGPVQHPHIQTQPQFQSQAMRRSEPDRFVKALITARPQPHLTSSFSTANSPGSPLQQSQSQSQLQLQMQMGSGQGKRLGRTAGSAGSLALGGNGGGSVGAGNGSGSGAGGAGGKGIGLKTMARGPDGQVVVAGNEGQ
jgi:hypothetical protein